MKRVVIVAACLPLVGCAWFEDLFDTIDEVSEAVEGLTNPTVVQALVLGVEEPESDLIDLDEIEDYEAGTAFTLFLADAADVSDLDNAPVEGAKVTLEANKKVDAIDDGEGVYLIEPDEALVYTVGEVWTVKVDSPGAETTSQAPVTLPAALDASVPEEWDANTAMSLDLRNSGFDAALILVFDGQTGDLTWTNQPEDIGELYEWTRGGNELGLVEIDASAFPGESIYAVGVAGIENASTDGFVEMNTLLSGVMAGLMRLYPVSTLPDFEIPDTGDFEIPDTGDWKVPDDTGAWKKPS